MTDSLSEDRLHAYAEASAFIGAFVWVGFIATGLLTTIEIFLSLAPLVVVPLCLRLSSTPYPDGEHSLWYKTATYTQPGAAVLAVFSFVVAKGPSAATLASLWLVVTVSVALFGLLRLLRRGFRPAEELLVDAGLGYLPIGGFWLVASRAGLNPLGFGDTIVALTAVHFHYAGFALPILLGLAGRYLQQESPYRVFGPAGYCIVIAPGLIALGITFSPALELFSVAVFVLVIAMVAVLTLIRVVPELGGESGVLVGVSSVSVLGVIALASVYAFTNFGVTHTVEVTRGVLDIETMVVTHGVLGSVGFALVGSLGWWLAVHNGGLPERTLDSGWIINDEGVSLP